MFPRTRIKAVIERRLAASSFVHLSRRRMADCALVLAYQNVVPRGERVVGDMSLHISQEQFAAQLDVLCETHDVVPLASLLDGGERSGERPRAVITLTMRIGGALRPEWRR